MGLLYLLALLVSLTGMVVLDRRFTRPVHLPVGGSMDGDGVTLSSRCAKHVGVTAGICGQHEERGLDLIAPQNLHHARRVFAGPVIEGDGTHPSRSSW